MECSGKERYCNMRYNDFDRKMERKFGRYAIRNLSLALILCYACGYLIQFINSSFLNYLSLDPYAIVHGQIWRLITWIIIPPDSSNIFFVLIMMLFYYSIGTALERTWGSWKYNTYIFSGILFTILGAFVMMAWAYLTQGEILQSLGASSYFTYYARAFSTYYVNMSIFLAYAVTFPNMRVLFMFFIPIKVKWLGIVYAGFLVYDMIVSGAPVRIAILCSLLNFILLWVRSRDWNRVNPKEMKRRRDWKNATNRSTWSKGSDGWMHSGQNKSGNNQANGSSQRTGNPGNGTAGQNAGSANNAAGSFSGRPPRSAGAMHRCAVCGRTEITNPELEFRYCSKCEGAYEYCSDHIFTHIHVKNGDKSSFDGNGNVKIRPKEQV